MDEAALVASARNGDAGAFNQLVHMHQRTAYNVAFRILGDHDAAADATQDAFLAAFRKIRTLRGGSFQAWLLRIVTNACYDQLRQRKRRPVELLGDLATDEDILSRLSDPQELPHERVERRELNQLLQGGIGRLPAGMRMVLVLADVQGLKYEEIAQVMGLEVGTVKSRLSRGRAQLRDYLLESRALLPRRYLPAWSEAGAAEETLVGPAPMAGESLVRTE